jgi:hypothetical protein
MIKKCGLAGLILLMCVQLCYGFEVLAPLPLKEKNRESVIVEATERMVNRQYEEKFELAEKSSPGRWFSVDIKPYANINLFSGEGLTCPVRFDHMELGKRVFYGVPFEVTAPAENNNKTAIGLPSTRLLPGLLPPQTEVAVGRQASVLYILQATYYTTPEGDQFFRLNYEDGSSHTQRITGTEHSGDWYHAHTRIHTEDVRYVLVPAEKGSRTSFRNMHIFQWKNPSPDKKIRSITFASDVKAEMGILIVAVTGYH